MLSHDVVLHRLNFGKLSRVDTSPLNLFLLLFVSSLIFGGRELFFLAFLHFLEFGDPALFLF